MISTIKVERINDMPIVVVDNFYNELEYNKIFNELTFLNHPEKLKTPEETGGAVDESGKHLKSNKGYWLDVVYADRKFSDILNINRKLFYPAFMSELISKDYIFKYIETSNSDNTLISYYEDGDHYKQHEDRSVLTALTWFYKSPKMFDGGNLIFEEDLEIDCVSNRMVIFPSFIKHRVTEVSMDKAHMDKNLGRFTMSQFMIITP